MWKRIQTLYLAISTGLIIALFFSRFGTDLNETGDEAVIMYYEYIPYLLMLIMLLTANVFAICSFKSPMLQARISMISALAMLGFQIWLAIDFFTYQGQMTFSVTMLFPLAAAFLDFIAARASLVDEMTVQSIRAIKTHRKGRKK